MTPAAAWITVADVVTAAVYVLVGVIIVAGGCAAGWVLDRVADRVHGRHW